MKKILFGMIVILSVNATTGFAQNAVTTKPATASAATATASFKEKDNTYDFGTIPQGTPVTHVFTVTNTGKAPLVLSAVNPSCGCTSPEWPKEPIAPGASAPIKVTYNAAAVGTFTKNVTVVSNAGNAQAVLYIKGEVKAPATNAAVPAPAPTGTAAPKKN